LTWPRMAACAIIASSVTCRRRHPGVPDGLKVDTAGRVFCVGSGGIWVMAPSGDVIGIIPMPEVVRNLAFGGPDARTLYLTPGGCLSTLEVIPPGIGPCR